MIAEPEGGRAVAAVPLGHVLLLPRSLFILTGTLYSAHLHGIEAVKRDTCVAPVTDSHPEAPKPATNSPEHAVPKPEHTLPPDIPVVVANAGLLGDKSIQSALETPEGWSKERGTRTSLTFRRANKTAKAGLMALAAGGRR